MSFSSLDTVDLGLDDVGAVDNLTSNLVASLSIPEATLGGDVEVTTRTEVMQLSGIQHNLDCLFSTDSLEGFVFKIGCVGMEANSGKGNFAGCMVVSAKPLR